MNCCIFIIFVILISLPDSSNDAHPEVEVRVLHFEYELPQKFEVEDVGFNVDD